MNPFALSLLTASGMFIAWAFARATTQNGNRNNLIGYRTTRSKQNDETWVAANLYSSRGFLITGIVTVLSGALGLIDRLSSISSFISLVLMLLGLILTIVFTERHLEKSFTLDKNEKTSKEPKKIQGKNNGAISKWVLIIVAVILAFIPPFIAPSSSPIGVILPLFSMFIVLYLIIILKFK